MKKIKFHIDLLQILFSLFFIFTILIAFIWIIKPFILSFTWAGIIVITTWPILIKLQYLFWGKRSIAILIIITVIILIFIMPILLLTNSLIDNVVTFMHLIFNKNNASNFFWLNKIPIIGNRLYFHYHKLIKNSGFILINKIQPYLGKTTGFFFTQASYLGYFMIHLILMLLFSILLYYKGENIIHGVYCFAFRVSGYRGKKTILLIGKVIRAVVSGIVITAIVQGILSGIGLIISGIPYTTVMVVLVIFLCLLQIGPLPILIPNIVWLYWNEDVVFGTILLIWSVLIIIIDNILKPILIRIGADLPFVVILSGTIGGFLAFGMIGLFIGPVIISISYRLLFSWSYAVIPPNEIFIKIFEKK